MLYNPVRRLLKEDIAFSHFNKWDTFLRKVGDTVLYICTVLGYNDGFSVNHTQIIKTDFSLGSSKHKQNAKPSISLDKYFTDLTDHPNQLRGILSQHQSIKPPACKETSISLFKSRSQVPCLIDCAAVLCLDAAGGGSNKHLFSNPNYCF